MNAKIWTLILLVFIGAALLSCGLLGNGSESIVGSADLILNDADAVVLANYRNLSEANQFPSILLPQGTDDYDIDEQLEDIWEDSDEALDTDFREVSSVFYVRLPRAGYMIAEGGFDFESIRDELEDLDFEEDDYRGFQMWSDDFGSGAALLEGSGVYVHGDKDAVEDVLKALDRGEGFMAPESGLRRALAASGIGIFAVASADCDATDAGAGAFVFLTGVDFGRYDLEGCDAVAVSFAESDRDESELVFGVAFRSDGRAESGAEDLQDALEDADDFDADVEDTLVAGDTATLRLTLDDERSTGTRPFGLLLLPDTTSRTGKDVEVIVQTVVVREEVPIEVPVVQTVVVERVIEVEVPTGLTDADFANVQATASAAQRALSDAYARADAAEARIEALQRAKADVEKLVVETVVVERIVEVEVPVFQTVVVEREVVVEKEVTVIVEKEVIIEQEVAVQPTAMREVDVESIVEKVVIPTPEPVRVHSPHITADVSPNEWPTIYDENGNLFPKPSSFKEAPMLATRVAAGELPPVEQRLPDNPLVLKPTRGIGKYGGTWYRGFTGPADGQNMERPLKDHLLFYEVSGQIPQPNIAESWTQNDDATEFTFTLRKGHKWSDGDPFTTADIMFWVDHMLHNEELNPTKPAWTQKGGETLKFEAIDEQTFKVTSPEPYAPFVTLMASVIVAGQHARGDGGDGLYAPRHYLEQFHPDFVGLEEAERKASEAGFDNWFTYFLDRNHANANPDAPMLTAWRVTGSINTNEWSFERNPYYFAVDTEGNQLPYIDRVVLTLAQNLEVLNLSALAGNYTVMGRHIKIAKLPLFLENAESAGYRIQFWRQPQSGIANLYINETWDGNAEIQSFLQNIEFRRALSMGIERDQINEVFFLGIGQTSGLCQGYPDPDNPGKYIGEDDVQFNADAANTILDSIGLDQKDGEGFRMMPSGERLTIQMPAVVAAFEDYPGINEMIARQWAVNIGVHAEVQSLERGLHGDRGLLNELMLTNWESSPRSTTLITPGHLLPVGGGGNTGRLYGDWHQSGGETGLDPAGINDLIKEQMDLYDESQSTAGPARFAEILQRVVELNCLNVNPITTVMNMPAYVAIIKNKVKNIPNPLPFSYHNQTSGNGFPEQWWIDDENAMEGK